MADFRPIRPNFYGKSVRSTVNTAGLAAVQASGSTTAGQNTFNIRSTNGRPLPGTTVARGQSINTPQVVLQAAINATAAAQNAVGLVDSALAAASALEIPRVARIPEPDPSLNRLTNSDMPPGGVYATGINREVSGPLAQFVAAPSIVDGENKENRVIIKDKTGKILTQEYLKPLKDAGGLLFPFVPTIQVTHQAGYELESLIHSVYSTPYYTSSTVDSITINGRFTAQTEEEGKYILAAMQFLRTVTKMFYGASPDRGTPPPVMFLDAHGDYLFKDVPVVVKSFDYTMPEAVNYITVGLGAAGTRVPVDMTMSVQLVPTYSRNKISNDFNLIDFANGKLLDKGFI